MAEVIEKKMIEIGSIAYDRNDILGEGAFGYVFSGTFRGENGEASPVAVKRVLNRGVNTDKREVDALKELRHQSNIVFLFGSEKDEEFHYFALERCAASMDQLFLPVGNSKKYTGPLPSDLDALLQLSEGLRYIHAGIDGKGFVHRDVKPGNVLISYPKDDGTVLMKWADFGFSKPVSCRGSFSISGMKGTTNWIAPEILAILGDEEPVGTQKGTVESDTWSAGCVFFAYLTKGKHPFAGGNGILSNILNSTPINLPAALPNDHFAFNIIKEMIQKEPKNRMKLSDVVEILKKEKETNQRQQQDDNVRRELETGQLYSWEQWNLVLRNNQLFIWSDDVAIEGISNDLSTFPRIKLNESDKTTIASLHYGKGLINESEEPGRKYLNKEMLEMVGITPGTASKALNDHFVPQGKEWEVYASELGDKLIVKGSTGMKDNIFLFGPSFYSTLHFFSVVCMTDGGKEEMIKELLDLCSSRPRPEGKELERIAALLHVGINPNCTNLNGETPLHLCIKRQESQFRLECLKILLEANQSNQEGPTLEKVNLDFRDDRQRNAVHLLLMQPAGISDPTVFESMKLLVHGGIDVHSKDSDGRTALHYLCENYEHGNIVEAMKVLIEKGVDVKSKDIRGHTALQYLCQNPKNQNIVGALELLIDNGADWADRPRLGQPAVTSSDNGNGNCYNPSRIHSTSPPINGEYIRRGVLEHPRFLEAVPSSPDSPLRRRISSSYVTDVKPPDWESIIDIRVTIGTEVKGLGQNVYPNCYIKPRGLALIMNFAEFESDVVSTRKGSEKDVINLDIVLKQLGYEVFIKSNLKFVDAILELDQFTKDAGHAKADSTVVAVMSHGRGGNHEEGTLIYTRDCRFLSSEDILRRFNNVNCPLLKRKPKMFLFQFCRGDNIDVGVGNALPSFSGPASQSFFGRTVTDGNLVLPVSTERAVDDMLIAYSTLPGNVSYREESEGTWFIKAICLIFMRDAHEFHVDRLFQTVDELIQHWTGQRNGKQTLEIIRRGFNRKFYFNPGIWRDQR